MSVFCSSRPCKSQKMTQLGELITLLNYSRRAPASKNQRCPRTWQSMGVGRRHRVLHGLRHVRVPRSAVLDKGPRCRVIRGGQCLDDGSVGKAGRRFLGNDVLVITGRMGAWGSDTEFEAKFSSDTCSRSRLQFFLSLPARSYF